VNRAKRVSLKQLTATLSKPVVATISATVTFASVQNFIAEVLAKTMGVEFHNSGLPHLHVLADSEI
jgi:hypothetical protein